MTWGLSCCLVTVNKRGGWVLDAETWKNLL
jgi:hypothetical protein